MIPGHVNRRLRSLATRSEGFALVFGAQALSSLASFLTAFLAARELPPETLSTFFLLNSVLLVVSGFTTSFSLSSLPQLYASQGEDLPARKEFFLLQSVLAAAAFSLPGYLYVLGFVDDAASPLFIATFIGSAVFEFAKTHCLFHRLYRLVFFAEVTTRTLQLLAVALSIGRFEDPYAFFAAYAAALGAGSAFILSRIGLDARLDLNAFLRTFAPKSFNLSRWFVAEATLHHVVNSFAMVFVVSIVDKNMLAVVGPLSIVANAFNVFLSAMISYFLPRLTQAYFQYGQNGQNGQNGQPGLHVWRADFQNFLLKVAALSICFVTLAWVFAPHILHLFYGPRFDGRLPLFHLLVIQTLVNFWVSAFVIGLRSLGRNRQVFVSYLGGAAVALAASYPLVVSGREAGLVVSATLPLVARLATLAWFHFREPDHSARRTAEESA